MKSEKIIDGERVMSVPGDTLHRMRTAHVDDSGNEWPAGTEYRPLSVGANGRTERGEQVISIAGKKVTFSGKSLTMPRR